LASEIRINCGHKVRYYTEDDPEMQEIFAYNNMSDRAKQAYCDMLVDECHREESEKENLK